MIKGEINLPNKIPNLNHIKFNGLSIFEFNNPKIKKIIEIKMAHNLIGSLFISGYEAIKINTIQKTIPKFLLDPTFKS